MSEYHRNIATCFIFTLGAICYTVGIELSFVPENVWTRLYVCHWFSKDISGHVNQKSQWHQENIGLKEGTTMFCVTRSLSTATPGPVGIRALHLKQTSKFLFLLVQLLLWWAGSAVNWVCEWEILHCFQSASLKLKRIFPRKWFLISTNQGARLNLDLIQTVGLWAAGCSW